MKTEYSIAKNGHRVGKISLTEAEVNQLLKLGYKRIEKQKILTLNSK